MNEKAYRVKEIFGPTIQGEGARAGRAAIFIRLAGCNQWNGRPEDRASSACPFCDTDFLGGEARTAASLIDQASDLAGGRPELYDVVLSGGEPLLQADPFVLRALASTFRSCQVETNGSRSISASLSDLLASGRLWVTVSPKVRPENLEIAFEMISEFKFVVPHPDERISPAEYFGAMARHFPPCFVQPIADDRLGPAYLDQVRLSLPVALALVFEFPRVLRLSLQTHKMIGVQ